VEVIEEAAGDGPVEFRPRDDSDGFDVCSGDVRIAAVTARPDRLAFALNVYADGRCDRQVAGRILDAVEALAAGPAALVDTASPVVRDEARRRGYRGPLRAPLGLGSRPGPSPDDTDPVAAAAAAITALVGRPVVAEPASAGRRFRSTVRRGSPRAVRRLTVADPGLSVTIPDTADLMVESVARAIDTILAVRHQFADHAAHLDTVSFDRTSEAEAARWAGQANPMVFSIHLNDNLAVASQWVAHRREQEAAGGRSRSAAVPHPYSRVDGVAAHEAWHQMEFKFRGRLADHAAFKRELGAALGADTLEHVIHGRQRNAPEHLVQACYRLAATVSPYATKNPLEATAEMFKLWWCGVSNPTIDCFGRLLDRYFGIGSVRPRG
jgi:hypothetical protein